jgi:hypothetical protein
MDNKKEESITFEEYNEQINTWYRANNIIREKSELYYDFLSSLLTLIDQTYLGADVIISQEDMSSHYTWCFNRVLSNFEHERIYFTNKPENYDYLWFFFYKGYYMCETENKYNILQEYFKLLFYYDKMKTPPELESFMDFYKILDVNLKKIN